MITIWLLLALAGISTIAFVFYSFSSSIPKGYQPVPGPKGLPIIGNVHQLSPQPQKQIIQWAREYGEIYRIRLGFSDWYMLCSPQAVKDIMDRQSAITSSRPPQPVAQGALSKDLRFLFMSYGPEWRKLRAITHKLLTPKVSDTFQPSQDFEAKQLLHDILTDNKHNRGFYMHVRRYTTSVIMTSTYGRRVPQWDCDDVRQVYAIMDDFTKVAAPGTYIADAMPQLGRLPKSLQWWHKSVEPYYQRQANLWMKYWTDLRTKMETGQAPECFVKHFIETDYEKQGITELQAAFVAGTMIEAGSETTSSSLNTLILYLSAYPEVQARAQDEISRVVGDTRSPTFGDEESLPYIRAIVKEGQRVRPTTNIGAPHYTTADVTYKNYIIPKGSIVAVEQYPIHYNPEYYPDPHTFKPERYLSYPLRAGAYAAGADSDKRDHFSFGAGRRICTGMHLAENSLFILVAKLLWAFTIRPPLDEQGKEMPVDMSDDAYEVGGNTLPKPFAARFIPRTTEVERVLKEEWETARREGFTLRNVKVDADGVVV